MEKEKDNGLIVAGSIIGAAIGGIPGAVIGGLLGSVAQQLNQRYCSVCRSQMQSLNLNGRNFWSCPKCGKTEEEIKTKKESNLRSH